MSDKIQEFLQKLVKNDMEKAFEIVIENMESLQKRIIEVEKENEELKSAYYKDEEIRRLKEELEKETDRYLSFTKVTPSVEVKVEEWQEEHVKKYHMKNKDGTKIGGAICFQYIFTPTEISTCLEIRCCCKSCANKKDILTLWD